MEVLDHVSAVLKGKGESVWIISPEDTVYDALVLMADKGIGALPVLESNRLVGILSERDYARKIILKGRSSRETKVREIMNAPPISITRNCSVSEAMRLITEHRIRHLPVVNDESALVGMISIGDLVKWIITSHEQTIEQLQSYIAGNI